MALLTVDFFSDALEMGATMQVVLPQPTAEQIGVQETEVVGDPPVLYLLHGLSDDHSAWVRYTSIERYAAAAGLAVVMPAVHRSFYANERNGGRYWDFVSEELPAVVARFLRVSTRPDETFVAGLSMGGYGALKLALTHPERFAAAASLSGALDLDRLARGSERRELFARVFGDRVGPGDDLFSLLDSAPAPLPALHVSCGTGDPLLASNRRFVRAARNCGAAVTTSWRTGGHEWGLWDRVIADVIGWLPLAGRAG